MDSSLGIKIVEQSQQQNHHQQQALQQQTQQHPHSLNNNNNIEIASHTVGVGTGDHHHQHPGSGNVILSNNNARINPSYPNPIKRPPPPPPPQELPPSSVHNKAPTNSSILSKPNNQIQRNHPVPSSAPLTKNLAKINTTAKIPSSTINKVTSITTAHTTNTSINTPENVAPEILTEEVDSFFTKGHHNSFEATEELIKKIDESQDESLARRVLNLYQAHYSTLERPWDHETFMYGLGLIYMHFNAYSWAIKSLRGTVYVRPGFPRSCDIHTRLGLIFKRTGRYRLSEKHFNLAIHDTRRDGGTSTKLELKFHLAHLCELQGKTTQAIELYEKLLQEKDLPDKLSANIHRNLGWIHYSTITTSSDTPPEPSADQLDPNKPRKNNKRLHDNLLGPGSLIESQKLDIALNHLDTSYRSVSDSQTSYYLGRCLTKIGKTQDAFDFYREVIDKEESTADTWCSIGVLYHQRQNQPWDALQAYIRSVQYDKKHAVAWMNLGILYETHRQFEDALKCYRHVLRSNSANMNEAALQTRINYIQKHLADIEASLSNSSKSDTSSDKLLSLEDLWNMESKTNQEGHMSGTSNITRRGSSLTPNATSSSSATQSQTKQQSALAPNRPSDQQRAQDNMTTPMEIDHPRLCDGQTVDQINQSTPAATTTTTSTTAANNTTCTKSYGVDSESTNSKGSAKPPEATTNNISGSLQSQDSTNCLNDRKKLPTNHLNGLQTCPTSNDCKSLVATQANPDLKPLHLESKDTCLNQLFTNGGASKDSGISSDSSTYADCALVPSQSTDTGAASYMSAERVLESCNEISTTKQLKKIDVSLLDDESKLPSVSPRSPIYPPLPTGALLPLAPSIFLDTKRELASKRLQDICLANPISIVRNTASALKLDLGLFSTKTLVESCPNQQIDITGHLFSQEGDAVAKGDDEFANPWLCERHQSTSTISRYASYQVSSFRQSLQDERDSKAKTHLNKESETDSNESAANKKGNADAGQGPSKPAESSSALFTSKPSPATKTKPPKKESPKTKYVKSADMIDLSDDKIWRLQIHELNKLPHFLKCVSASNMLTHIGSQVPGLNTITMSMHVPGCKIVDSRMPSQFCSVHINTGPGDYEWCAVSGEYESVLRKICNRNGLDWDQRDWWPLLSDLQEYQIPVYRFAQRPGDLVWVNSTTLYWVQASGWANNIHWNLGPLSARQYQLALESCELSKFLFRQFEVPMIQMTWNIVMNISIITDDDLFWTMANVLRRSLRYCKHVEKLVKESNCTITQLDDEQGPTAAKYCTLCEIEIFNVTFESTEHQDESVHCVECARRADGAFQSYKIKQVHELKYLMKVYDNFIDMKKKFQVKQMQMRRKYRAQQ